MTNAISVVVLSHARPRMLQQALAALHAQTIAPAEVLVVDNRSPESARIAEVVRDAGYTLLALNDNEGFTGGMNLGLSRVSSEYVLLTEDDLVLEPECLSQLLAHLSLLEEAGLVSGLLKNLGEGTIRCDGGECVLEGKRLSLRLHRTGEVDAREERAPHRTGFIPGAFVFARTSYLRELGGFRHDFFMYVEDVELSLRVIERGDAIWIVPTARAGHQPIPSTYDPPTWLDFHKHKNMLSLYVLHGKPLDCAEYFLRYAQRTVRTFVSSPFKATQLVRAGAWALRRVPRFLRERRERTLKRLSATGSSGAPPGRAA